MALRERPGLSARPRKRDTFNRQDGIALQGGEAMVASGQGTEGPATNVALTVGVDPAADWKDQGFGPGGPMGGPPPGGPGRGSPPGVMAGWPPGPPPGGFPGGSPLQKAGRVTKTLTGEARLKAIVPGV
jgi:hypothetical protein